MNELNEQNQNNDNRINLAGYDDDDDEKISDKKKEIERGQKSRRQILNSTN